MSDRAFGWSLFAGCAAFMVLIVVLLVYGNEKGTERCATIGAKYVSGRDFSACVKPDGSMWRLP